MGALKQGPAVATGSEFVMSKLKTRKSAAAGLAASPAATGLAATGLAAAGLASNPTAASLATAPGTSSSPAKRARPAEVEENLSKTFNKTPLRIIKLSPALFERIKKTKMEADAAKAEVGKLAKAEVEKEAKTEVEKEAKTEVEKEAKTEQACSMTTPRK